MQTSTFNLQLETLGIFPEEGHLGLMNWTTGLKDNWVLEVLQSGMFIV